MTFARLKAALAVLFILSLPLAATSAESADAHAADSTAVQKLFVDFNRLFNDHEAQAASKLFVDDADFIVVGGNTIHGAAQIEQHLQPLFAGRLKTVHREVVLRGIRFLRPDTATVDSDYVTSGIPGANGGEMPPVKGLYDWIVMKHNGQWRIVVWHESNLPVPAVPPTR